MSADTEPGPPPNDTEPGSAPNDTDPDGQEPPVEPPRRALPFELEARDEEVASLLGKLAPARVAPAVGDTPETDGHSAAKFRGAPHAPPRPHDTPTPQAPVIVDVTTPDPVPLLSDTSRRAALDTTVVPPHRQRRFRLWMVLPAISVGAIAASIVVALVVRAPDAREAPAASVSPVPIPTPTVSIVESPSPVASASTSGAAPFEPSAQKAAAAAPTAPTAMTSSKPAIRSTTSSHAPAPPIAKPTSSASPSALPPDIKWRLD